MKMLQGVAASPGLAIGPAQLVYPAPPVDVTAQRTVEASEEIARLERAIEQTIIRMNNLMSAVSGATLEILEAQREMLSDPELKEGAVALITAGYSAEAAVTQVVESYAVQLSNLPDEYLAARAEDVRESGQQIVAQLQVQVQGVQQEVRLERAAILVAHDLAPADTVGLDPTLLQAVVTETGSPTGHLAIVAQGLGIPAVVGAVGALAAIEEGMLLVVDGDKGSITVAPDEESRTTAQTRLVAAQHEKQELLLYRNQLGATADGVRVEVFANIGSLAEASKAVEMGAEGVGLFRTELLAAQGLPTEADQYTIYEQVAALIQKPLVVRTFDIGGDKPVPGLDIPPESNPFLGWRGIRLSLDRPEEVFLPQLRALLRVAARYDVRIMLPMVTAPEEVAAARALVEQASKELERAGQGVGSLPLGIMVETPAAAITLDRFRGLIDFVSIGTNDLIQYTYAVDRTNTQVQSRARPLGTATLRLIAQVCEVGLPVAVCGQLAGDTLAVPILVGLGVRELSVAPTRIPFIKRILATMTFSQMQAQAQQALKE